MPKKQKGTRVQFRLRTLLWGTVWFALVLAVCVGQQHAATRQREALESGRVSGFFPARRFVSPHGRQPAAMPVTRPSKSAI